MSSLSQVFQDIANSIRSKAGSAATIAPVNMANAINNIPTGGGTVTLNNSTMATELLGKFNDPVDIVASTSNCELMFNGCTEFNQPINLPAQISYANYMFMDCHKFNQPLDLANHASFYTPMCGLLINCHEFNSPITFPVGLTAPLAVQMFTGCYKFNQPISNDLINAMGDNGTDYFKHCREFNQPVPALNVTSGNNMFWGCNNFNQPINFQTDWSGSPKRPIWMANMFRECANFNQPVPFVNGYCSYALYNCKKFNQPINFGNQYAGSYYVQNAVYMLANCTNFNQPCELGAGLSNAVGLLSGCTNFNSVVGMSGLMSPNFSYMFNGCTNLTDETVNNFAFPSSMYASKCNCVNMFSSCHSLVNVNGMLNNMRHCVGNATNMFANCSNLTYTVGNTSYINTSVVGMYNNCQNLIGTDDGTPFNFMGAGNFDGTFQNCKKLGSNGGVDVLMNNSTTYWRGYANFFGGCSNDYKKRIICLNATAYTRVTGVTNLYSIVGKAVTYADTTETYNGVSCPAKYNADYNVYIVNGVGA